MHWAKASLETAAENIKTAVSTTRGRALGIAAAASLAACSKDSVEEPIKITEPIEVVEPEPTPAEVQAEIQKSLDELPPIYWNPENPTDITIPLEGLSESQLSLIDTEPRGTLGQPNVDNDDIEVTNSYIKFPWGLYPMRESSKMRAVFQNGDEFEFTLPPSKMDLDDPAEQQFLQDFANYEMYFDAESIAEAPDGLFIRYEKDMNVSFSTGTPQWLLDSYENGRQERNKMLEVSGWDIREEKVNTPDTSETGVHIEVLSREDFEAKYPKTLQPAAVGSFFRDLQVIWIDSETDSWRQPAILEHELLNYRGISRDIKPNTSSTDGRLMWMPTDPLAEGSTSGLYNYPSRFTFLQFMHKSLPNTAFSKDIANNTELLQQVKADVIQRMKENGWD